MIRRLRAARAGEEGFALLMVVASMAVLSLFVLISLGTVVANVAPSRGAQDARSASAAAEAGVQDYLARLNLSDTYWTVSINDAVKPLDATNLALTTTGANIAGLTSRATYTYRVLDSRAQVQSSGVLHLQVTGRSVSASGRAVTRDVVATFKTGAGSFAYTSNYEVAPPDVYAHTDAKCDTSYWFTASPNARSSATGCLEPQWNKDDVVVGPVRTNDAMLIAGAPTFSTSTVLSGWVNPTVAGKYYRPAVANNYVANAPSTLPQYVSGQAVALPTTTTTMLDSVQPGTNASAPGCLYTGATQISFNTDNTMQIRSPATTQSNVPARCYDTSAPNTVQTRTIPPVIYVRPATSCSSFPAAAGPFTYPVGGITPEVRSTDFNVQTLGSGFILPAYDCADGTAYVQSTSSTAGATGATTVVAENDVVVTGNLLWPAAGTTTGSDGVVRPSMLGLISGDNTWVYNPVKRIGIPGCSPGNCYASLRSTPYVTTVNASVLAIEGGLLAQNYNLGSAWTGTNRLNVTGQVAQYYRGPMATGNTAGAVTTGFNVTYTLDARLATASAPYFPRPAQSPWQVALVSDR